MKGRVLSIRGHLVLLALFVLAPQIVLGGYLAYRNARETQASVEGSTDVLARTLVDSVDREFVGLVGVLQGLATSSSLQRKDFPAFYPRAAAAFNGRKASGVAIRDSAGNILVNTNAPVGAPLPPSNPALRDFDRDVIGSRSAVVSNLHSGAVSRRPLVLVGTPVTLEDGETYSMATGLDPEALLDIVRDVALPEGWLATVIDRSGHVVARSRDPEKYLGAAASPEFLAMTTGTHGRVLSTTLDGEPVITAYVSSAFSGWKVLVSAPRTLLDRPVHVLWLSLAGLGGIAVLTSAIAAMFFTRIIGGGLRSLAREARALGRGEVPQETRSSVAEVMEVHEILGAASRELARRADHQAGLMAELDHRVKNTLAVIQSLIVRTMRTAPSREQGTKSLQGRVMALARSHEALSDARWERVQLSALVDAVARSEGITLSSSGPEIWLAPRAVVAFAQALHELATNVLRHGFSAEGAGRVDLRWDVEDGDLVVTWLEQGGQLAEAEGTGFGNDIIRLCVERQLGGRVSWNQRPDGLIFEARVPLNSDLLGRNAFVRAAE